MTLFPYPAQALLDPINMETVKSLIRLEILKTDGTVDTDGLTGLAVVIGADLSELFDNEGYATEHAAEILLGLNDCQTQFLFLCLLYDEFEMEVPRLLLTLAAHKPALEEFLSILAAELEFNSEIEYEIEPDILELTLANISRYEKERRRHRRNT